MKKSRAVIIPSIPEVEEERKRLKYRASFRAIVRRVLFSLVSVAAVSAILATLFFPVLEVSGNSMEPTLYDGDIIVLFASSEYKRGDICGFYWQNKLLLKRIIAIPGDTVSMDADGNVYVNGEVIPEPYVTDIQLGECDISFPCQVPAESYFVLGDHRGTSIDSRSEQIGCIENEKIIGKVFIRLWPFDRIKLF